MTVKVVQPGFVGLVDPYLKTARAKVHLENLREQVSAFCNDPCEFFREDNLEKQLHLIRLKVKDIPDTIPLIAGDLFYCLRASLDQLVWCLAKINATPGYPEGTQFPIFDQRDIPRFDRQTRGVPADALRIIESLQPYNTPDAGAIQSHLLWRLNKLCNIDKHIRIPVHGVTGTLTWDTFIPWGKEVRPTEFGESGVMTLPLLQKGHVALNPRVRESRIVFGDLYWKIECDFAGIEAIYEFVANSVLPRFARFFQQTIGASLGR
ncbi:MAG TPA: hypothetical protein VGR72_06865 [Candidatus Acidoferrales bacterium]|nr:hypothetical protein [Candidatus Acidoferrales bacterium]